MSSVYHRPPQASSGLGNLAPVDSRRHRCRRDPSLRYWHHEGDLLSSTCWDRVEHVAHDVGDVIEACQVFRRGEGESVSAAGLILADFGMASWLASILPFCSGSTAGRWEPVVEIALLAGPEHGRDAQHR